MIIVIIMMIIIVVIIIVIGSWPAGAPADGGQRPGVFIPSICIIVYVHMYDVFPTS